MGMDHLPSKHFGAFWYPDGRSHREFLGHPHADHEDTIHGARRTKTWISPRLEVTLRMGWAAIFASILAFADTSSIIPPSNDFLVGILGISLTWSLPKQLYGLGAMIPFGFGFLMVLLMGVTIMLSAATFNSDGVFLAFFTLWALFISGFYSTSHFDVTASLVNVLIASTGIISLSTRVLVQEGFSFDVDLSDYEDPLVAAICNITMTMTNTTGCSLEDFPSNTTFSLEIPQEADLLVSGQTATIGLSYTTNETTTTSNSNNNTYIITANLAVEGGMWVVKGLWKWRGLENPLAIFRNLLITFCWALLVYTSVVLIPPIRTVRQQLSQTLVPASLLEASRLISNRLHNNNNDNTMEDSANNNKSDNIQASQQQTLSDYRTAVSYLATMNLGKGAGLILFEPRMLESPTENLTPKLSDLMLQASLAILASMSIMGWKNNNTNTNTNNATKQEEELEQQQEIILMAEQQDNLEALASIMRTCADALIKNDSHMLHNDDSGDDDDGGNAAVTNENNKNSNDDGDKKEDTRHGEKLGDETHKETKEEEKKEEGIKAEEKIDDILQQRGKDLRRATKSWVDVINKPEPVNCGKEGWKNIASIYGTMILLPMILVIGQIEIILKLLPHRGNVNIQKTLWILKLVGGYVLLFAMTLYWEQYSSFAIPLPEGNIGAVYSGWQLLAYGLVWQPSVEGTLSKGTARIMGNVVGGFGAWLGAIVCSGSYDQSVPLNPYGTAAWLTITTMICAWFANQKAGFVFSFGSYYVSTQALILLEIFIGKGSRDELVVNRTVATTTGCAMAIVLAFFPPYVKGNDPKWIRSALTKSQEKLADLLQDYLNGKCQDSKEYRKSIMGRPMELLKFALFLLKDSQSSVKLFKFLHGDPRLMDFSNATTVGISSLSHVLELAIEDNQPKGVEEQDDELRQELEATIRRLKRDATDTEIPPNDMVSFPQVVTGQEVALVPSIRLLEQYLRDTKHLLDGLSENDF